MDNVFDVIIIGGGPAGLTGAIYALRGSLKVLVIEKEAPGGKIIKTNKIYNYPTVKETTGTDLAIQMYDHAYSLGMSYVTETVLDIINENPKKVITNKKEYFAKAIIIATGTKERKIGIPGEDYFFGRGVSYCATCDGPLYKNKDIAVIGDFDTALNEALYLATFAKKLYLICSKNSYSNLNLINEINNKNNIEVIYNNHVVSINGKTNVESISLEDRTILVSSVFPFIGLDPATRFVSRLGIIDNQGYIITNSKMETSIPGIYAAGDVIKKELRQIVTAENDGAIAANQIIKYLDSLK